MLLARHIDALPVRPEGDAVIAADDRVALEAAPRQWEVPVRAAPVERDRLARFGAVEHQRRVHDRPPEQLAPEVLRKGRDIPGVAGCEAAFAKRIHLSLLPIRRDSAAPFELTYTVSLHCVQYHRKDRRMARAPKLSRE